MKQRGLRVVDASVFPSIPGYFIAVPIMMVSEKAADALLAVLTNLRIGYWWDTRLSAGERPGRARQPDIERMKQMLAPLFRAQGLLLAEARARFPGPNARYWNLSDGGHFDNSGAYELIRRRVPMIIAVDAGRDPLENIANLVRQVRIDFGAETEFLEPDESKTGWDRFGRDTSQIPDLIRRQVEPLAVGALSQLGQSTDGRRAVLARIAYPEGEARGSWMLVIASCLIDNEPLDIAHYKRTESEFPHHSTLDQFFDEQQWESYRRLGEQTAADVTGR